ncbi:hypothetical protein FDP41_006462 [Naegleria fowleri]|uniref:CYRIA/CYRIB Rac1 binding domain-containing protein n=1 Tax=Naegleria fowleri TaxID=5763 RepID=A0A6A5BM77_NAEFO|nr:uncharacterized protein FDP41_006982 [Naegleria fowleri]XP_044559143.1 uncharacterized protein FDP41_006462 [Naegleria fowleri]KAF0973999.1 hypothetical protein FDP41_006982 [Naegleria fowleri]KAF0974430.1 hypothetical protein FDP41_006462 [Naegleria fowleri]CAG4717340.1 unnamed protein product [Naegleria fowleri]
MSKIAEKLYVLRQHSDALLQRLYTIKNDLSDPNLRPDVMKPTLNVDMKRLFAKLAKDAPHIAIDELEKVQGFDWVLNNMTQLFNQVHPIYLTFRELNQWADHAQQTINEISTNANIDFVQDVNFLTCYDYLQVLVGYVKLVLMMNRIKDKELIVCLLNLSYLKLNGTPEPNINRVWKFFKDFEDPIPKLQEEWNGIQDQVGRALMGLIPAFDRGTFSSLNIKRPLEMLSEPDRIPFPAVDETYQHLSCYQDIIEWIAIIYSCCPHALTKTPDKPIKMTPLVTSAKKNKEVPIRCYEILLQRVLANHLVIPLYGDEVYNFHDAFKEYVMIKKFGDLKKEAKTLKALQEMAIEKCQDYHKELRNYLRLQLKSLLNMMKDQPGLLGPKFNLVLAAISMARSEIMWYFHHNNYISKLPNQKKVKEVKETLISEMIYLMDEMLYVCVQHREVIRKYSLKIIRGLYYTKLRGLIEQCRGVLDLAKVSHIIDSILNDIQNTEDFEALRLNWKRVEAFLSSFQFKQSLPELTMLFATMTKIVVFSKHVDGLYDELVEKGSLKQLYFYKEDVDKIFSDGLIGSKSQPLYSTAFIRILNTYADNIHPQLNPSLRNKIGQQSVQMAESMLGQLVDRIKKGLDLLNSSHGYRMLTHQIGGDVAAQIILRRYGKNKQYIEEPPVPGVESNFDNNSINDMRDLERNVTQLLYSLSRYDEIVVYDTAFYPVEYLRTVLEEYISEYIKRIATTIDLTAKEMKNDSLQAKFITPTELLSELHSFMSSLKIIEQCCSLNTEEIVLNAILEHFVHLNYVESPFGVVQTTEPTNLISMYAQWYTEIVSDPQKYKTLYHPNRQTFVSTKETPIQTYNVEQYLDYNELKALITLTGPYGFRAFNQSLLDNVYTISERVREVLSQSNNALREIENKLYDEKFLLDKKVRQSLQTLEPLLGLLIQLGGILEFRRGLQQALQSSVRRNAPAIYDVVDSAFEQYPRNFYGDAKFLPIDALATDCGFAEVDHSLRLKLSPLVDRSQVWEVLPIAFAALVLLEKCWREKDSVYDVNLEGWYNNTHLSITAFHRLMQAVHSIKSNKIVDLEKDYKRFAEFAAMILLHMNGTKGYEKQYDNCCIFLDRTLKTSKHLDISFFEDLLPYPLIRTTYVRFFEPHQFEELAQEAANMEKQAAQNNASQGTGGTGGAQQTTETETH